MPGTSRRPNMPAIIVERTPSPPSPKVSGVAFARNPVQSVSRPTNDTENHALYEFEFHAQRCKDCHDPYDVYKKGYALCPDGHDLAANVALYLYNKEGEAYSAREGSKTVRVEIPAGYDEARGLLKAVERSLRHRSKEPFISMDKSYYVATREPKPSRKGSVKVSQKRRDSIVDWPEAGPKPILVTRTPNSSKRGSLYESDLKERRLDFAKYNIEVREPNSNRTAGYHR